MRAIVDRGIERHGQSLGDSLVPSGVTPAVRWRMGYAWPPRPSALRSMGANRIVLDEALSVGRLHRSAGDALCKPRRRFRDLDVREGEEVRRAGGEGVSCVACIRVAERIGLDLGGRS